MSSRTKICPKCKMEIPDNAEICPYCRSRLVNSWGLPTADSLGLGKSGGQQKRSSNSGCMVIIPLIVVAAYSIYYVICAC